MIVLMMRLIVGVILVVSSGSAQSTASPVTFEVATIRPSGPVNMAGVRSGAVRVDIKIGSTRVDMATVSLFRLICIAYKAKPYQVAGPDWLKTTMYDIQAKIPEGDSPGRVPEMLQALLVSRFGLKIHHESREQAAYEIVTAKGGPRMKPAGSELGQPSLVAGLEDKPAAATMSVPTTEGIMRLTRRGQSIEIDMPGGEIVGKIRVTMLGGTGGAPKVRLESSGTTMNTLAEMLSVGIVERPVVNMTGLPGAYEIALDISQEEAMRAARAAASFLPVGRGGNGGGTSDVAASEPSSVSIFSSIQNLGLRLESRKLPLDVLVIDHIEKVPTEN